LSAPDARVASGRASVIVVDFTTYALFFLSVAHAPSMWLPFKALILGVLLYLVHQGSLFSRNGLVLVYSISIVELVFSFDEPSAYGQVPLAYTVVSLLGYALCCVLLLRPNVRAFMRHQRIASLSPPSADPHDDPHT
jgi:hypothetical protein